jgi:protein-tyrosine phosphatase
MKILMVCLGNICRSPLAEGILRSKISNEHTVASAGTISFHEGEQPDKRSISTAKEHGVDISKQKAQYLKRNFLINLIKYFVWIPKTIKMFCL